MQKFVITYVGWYEHVNPTCWLWVLLLLLVDERCGVGSLLYAVVSSCELNRLCLSYFKRFNVWLCVVVILLCWACDFYYSICGI